MLKKYATERAAVDNFTGDNTTNYGRSLKKDTVASRQITIIFSLFQAAVPVFIEVLNLT